MASPTLSEWLQTRLRSDPRYVDLRPMASGPTKPSPDGSAPRIYPTPPVPPGQELDPRQVILHDYGRGANPRNFSPYHISVDSEGRIFERYGPNERAPHAFRSNPQAYSISYAGPVGSTPTPAAMDALRFVAHGVRGANPNLEFLGHGEAYERTRGGPHQASREGRPLSEASWRNQLFTDEQPSPSRQAPVPMQDRGITTFAGMRPQAAPQFEWDENGGINPNGLLPPATPQPPPVTPPAPMASVGPWQTTTRREPETPMPNFGNALAGAIPEQDTRPNQFAMGLLNSVPPPAPPPPMRWLSDPLQRSQRPGFQRFQGMFG